MRKTADKSHCNCRTSYCLKARFCSCLSQGRVCTTQCGCCKTGLGCFNQEVAKTGEQNNPEQTLTDEKSNDEIDDTPPKTPQRVYEPSEALIEIVIRAMNDEEFDPISISKEIKEHRPECGPVNLDGYISTCYGIIDSVAKASLSTKLDWIIKRYAPMVLSFFDAEGKAYEVRSRYPKEADKRNDFCLLQQSNNSIFLVGNCQSKTGSLIVQQDRAFKKMKLYQRTLDAMKNSFGSDAASQGDKVVFGLLAYQDVLWFLEMSSATVEEEDGYKVIGIIRSITHPEEFAKMFDILCYIQERIQDRKK
ncbi:hypothetical protein PROFUN_04886 [Planoprotostelium fungivorum]|uniref:CRC domain-containing protein n=1 Tax=Planoprotostelium fungivorum TaxID=1890364 RepID=A0A2P6NF69_9EUKA|nr:hypothetical protein PROFUN_04886 [Planoprotostelium fungivorum]